MVEVSREGELDLTIWGAAGGGLAYFLGKMKSAPGEGGTLG